MSENKTSKYLKYAVGEILLVVVGILIALQVNNWNVNRVNQSSAKIYLEDLIREIESEVSNLNKVFISRYERKMNGLKSAKAYYEQPFQVSDTLSFLNEISYGAVASSGLEQFNRGVFESLISTGTIGYIQKDLRSQIQNHYSSSEVISDLSQNQRSNYQNLVNGMRPFNPEAPKEMTKIDQIRYMKALETEEFIRQVNIELSNGMHNLQRANEIIDSANNLISSITEYLNNND